MLTLPIKKKWFDMIVSGEKKEEYREIKPFYESRLGKIPPNWKTTIRFRNGYSSKSPSIVKFCSVSKGRGREEWGAEAGKEYFVLKIES